MTALTRYDTPNNHPLHSVGVWLSTGLFGETLFGLRGPAFVGGILSVAAGTVLTWRLCGRAAAIFAGSLLASAPWLMFYGSFARGYSLNAAAGTVAILGAWEGWHNDRAIGRHLYLVSLSVAYFVLPTTLYLHVALVIWGVLRLDGWRWRQLPPRGPLASFVRTNGVPFYLDAETAARPTLDSGAAGSTQTCNRSLLVVGDVGTGQPQSQCCRSASTSVSLGVHLVCEFHETEPSCAQWELPTLRRLR